MAETEATAGPRQQPVSRPRDHVRPAWVAAAAVGLGALLLRLFGLGSKPFWIAEIQELAWARQGRTWENLVYSAGDLAGYGWHGLCAFVGLPASEWLARLPAAVAGAGTATLVTLALGLRQRVLEGVAAGLLAALSLPLLAASQEARFYAGLSFFVAAGVLVQLHLPASAGKRRWLAGADAGALLCHPYAVFWIGMRWAAVAAARAWPFPLRFREVAGYLAAVVPAAMLQTGIVLLASPLFRELHSYFALQPYPPDFSLFADLFGHLGTGAGADAAVFAALALAGLFAAALSGPAEAAVLAAVGLLAPLLVCAAIFLAGARFSMVHFLPAAVPLYLAAARGMSGGTVLGWRRGMALGACCLVLAACGWRMAALDLRYLERATRLEMGADLRGACGWLGEHASGQDAVVTAYDKYFTQLAWYCGPALAPEVRVLVPERPREPAIVRFLHLGDAADGPRLTSPRVATLGEAVESARPVRRLFVVVPLYESIESGFSEWLGWAGGDGPYGRALGPAGFAGWTVAAELPLVRIFSLRVDGPLDAARARDVESLLGQRRPLM